MWASERWLAKPCRERSRRGEVPPVAAVSRLVPPPRPRRRWLPLAVVPLLLLAVGAGWFVLGRRGRGEVPDRLERVPQAGSGAPVEPTEQGVVETDRIRIQFQSAPEDPASEAPPEMPREDE